MDRLPLGVPSFLLMGSLELARDLIRKPSSSRATGAAAEREAGYVLLGSACACLPAEMLKVSVSTYLSICPHPQPHPHLHPHPHGIYAHMLRCIVSGQVTRTVVLGLETCDYSILFYCLWAGGPP
jgi:hypothetical protein